MKSLLLFLMMICCAGALTGQQHFIQYNDKNGLPSNLVYFVYQDKKGFIWIATDKGVCRFDGTEFRHFTTADGLGSNEVFRIAEDTAGRVVFYCSDNSLSSYYNGKIQNSSQSGFDGKITVATFGSFSFSSDNIACVNFGFKQIQYSFQPFRADTGYFTSVPVGEYQYKTSSGARTINESEFPMLEKELTDGGVRLNSIYDTPFRLEFDGDTLLVITKKFVSLYKLIGTKLFKIGRIDLGDEVNVVNLVRPGILGVTSFKSGTQILSLRNEFSVRKFSPAEFTTHSLLDNEGNYWFATYNDGLFLCLSPDVTVLDRQSGMIDEKIISLGKYRQYLFAGHTQGRVSYLSSNAPARESIGFFHLPTERPEFNAISGFARLGETEFLAATNNGIASMKGGMGNPSSWDKVLLLGYAGSVKDLFVKDSLLFVITSRDLYVMATRNKEIIYKAFFDSLRLTSVEESWDGSILLGSMNGLYQLRMNGKEATPMQRILPQQVRAVVSMASKGNITAIGTDNDGVLIHSDKYTRNLHYPDIVSNNINRVVWDDSSGLWICTAKGMNYVLLRDTGGVKEIRTYNISSGLPSDYVTDVIRMGDTCYVGTNRGIAILPVTAATHMTPPVLIKDDTIRQYRIPYGHRAFFQFAGLSFKSLGQVMFKFRLKGFDTAWALSKEGNRELELLPPGNYALEVKAVDRFGQESETLTIPVEVVPRWYQLTWLRWLGVLLLVGLVSLLVRDYYKVRLVVQKKDFEKQMAVRDERQRISSEIHDDIIAGLSGVRLQTELVKNKSKDTELQKDMQRIHSSVSELSVKIRDVIWSLNAENDTLESLLYYIQSQAVKMFEFSSTKLKVELPAELPKLSVTAEKRRNLYLIVKEALHNIIKHAAAAQASVEIEILEDKLEILIKDDGIGYDGTGDSRGMGVRTMQQRIRKLGGQFSIRNANGTTVFISVPLDNKGEKS